MGDVKILKASAGSGKTYQLAYAYIRNVIHTPALYRNILAVTFTNKATEEMKQRIIREINALAHGATEGYLRLLERDLELSAATIQQRAIQARTRILHDYSHFTIVTIDKFFQRIIRSFIKELGIDINFNLELQTDSLLENAADRLIEAIAENDTLRKWVVRFAEEKIDLNGKWDVRGEIVNLGRELFKEQYKRLHNEPISQQKLAAIVSDAISQCKTIEDSLQQIALEALNLITQMELTPTDFAYGRQGCIGYFCKAAEGEFTAYGKRVQDALLSEDKWVSAKSPIRESVYQAATQLRPLLQQLCDIYDRNIRFLNTTRLIRTNYRSFALLNDLEALLNTLCAEQHLIPISETNGIIHKLIAGNDTPFIYEKVGNTFSHFMIDEFQDTSSQQWDNFLLLLENAVAQHEGTPVLLVGDIKQSIYRWRGGDWQILGRRVRESFDQLAEQTLDTNFRSFGVVVDFNNNLIKECVRQDNKLLNELLTSGVEADTLSKATRTDLTDMLETAYQDLHQKHHRSPEAGYVQITEYDSADTLFQQQHIIQTLEELQQRGYNPGEIAILVRTNAQGVSVARKLLDHKALHPDTAYCYDVVTQEALLIGNSDTVGFIVAVLKITVNANDLIQRAIYNRYQDKNLGEALQTEEVEFIHRLRLRSIDEAFAEIVLHYQLHRQHNDIAYIQAFEEQIHTFGTSRIADIPLFLQWWDETGATQSISLPRNRDAINIITIHKAKGLQYKAVLIPYCDWSLQPQTGTLLWAKSQEAPFDTLGYVPLSWNKTNLNDSYFAEAYCREMILSHIDNINLFYVAATRAEQELHILLPCAGKEGSSRLGTLIHSAISTTADQQITVGTLKGHVGEAANNRTFCFGTPLRPTPEPSTLSGFQTDYPIEKNNNALKFRLGTQRYFEETDTTSSSLRSYGIIMHKLFEQVKDHTEIAAQLKLMRANSAISQEEALHVEEQIESAFHNPLIASWFDTRWNNVYNEHTILIPHDRSVRRPDRVLTKGSEAVVIDYKFGQNKRPHHARQIKVYMQLLHEMGYRTVQGYLWYVERQEVEQIHST